MFLRYDVERALFAGELDVATIPQQWNSYMKERLDVGVPDDAAFSGHSLELRRRGLHSVVCFGVKVTSRRSWRGAPET